MLAGPYFFQSGLSRFFQSSFNAFLAGLMPRPLFRLYGYTLGLSYMAFRNDHRQQIAAGVLNHLGGDDPCLRRSKLVWKTYFGIFEHYIEKMINAYHPLDSLTDYLTRQVEIRNEVWLNEAVGQKKGVLMVTGHFGAVEYLPLFLALKHYRPAMIMRFKTEPLRRVCRFRCSLFNIFDIDADEPKVAFRALAAIRQGRTLVTLCDEFSNWRPHPERTISVLGNPVRQDKTLDLLYRRSKPPVCLGMMQRRKGGFTLHIEPIANGDPSVPLSERAWHKMEHFIRQYPEQWYQWREVADRLAAYRLKEK